MTTQRLPQVVLLLVGVVAAAVALALTAANTVPSSNVGRSQQAITAQSLAPAQCAGMGLTTVVTDGNGTSGNDLVVGTAAPETLNGNQGDDCIVGGDGIDVLRGGPGTDVCIGGAGIDTFNQCETQIQ
jgi:Ca2+-binding RTX toxin-like protein